MSVTGLPRDAITIHDPWEFYAGDDWPIAVECNDADGLPIDLNTVLDCTWKLAQINADGSTAIVKIFTMGIGINVDAEQSNLAIIIVPRVDTNDYTGSFFDELTVTTADNLRSHQYRGRIDVVRSL